MSIASLKFNGDLLAVTDEFNLSYFFNKYYKSANLGNTVSFTSGIEFSLPINATGASSPMTTQDIFTYANGVTFALKYRKYYSAATIGGTYFLEAWAVLKDKDGNTFREVLAYNSSVTPGVTSEEPWIECYYTPGYVQWTQNNPTIVNEEANQAWFDVCYFKNINQVLDKPFFGTQKQTDFQSTWERFAYTYVAENDTQLNNDMGYYVTAGDGTNPFNFETPEDPYDPSQPGGGDKPEYGPSGGDNIDFPDLPTGSVFTTGILSAYNPSASELTGLAAELWSNTFVSSLEKLMNDPFEAIVSLSMLPLDIPHNDAAIAIKIGNYVADQTSKKVTAQYVTVAGGSFTVPRAWNNFLDYTQTEVDIYIPFVGFLPLDIDDCMGKTLTLSYNIDMLTGSGIALLKCENSVLYAKPVNVAVNIPLTGSSKAQLYTGLMSVATTAVTGALVSGPAGAVIGGAAGAISTAATKTHSQVDRSGNLSANTGVLGDMTAYIVIHRPTQSLPKDFKTFTGYTSNITSGLAQCKGYTEVEYVHLTGISGATDTELAEIEQLLKNGVII